MPVNYERVPWDPKNSVAVRMVNQVLAEQQRKAQFVDDFLHAPRVVLYFNGPTPWVVWCVLHPSYPIITAQYKEVGVITTPPQELTPTTDMDGVLHSLFDWRNVDAVQLYVRDTDTGANSFECFNRYFRGVYQRFDGKDPLFPQLASAAGGWQSTGLYVQYFQALCVHDDWPWGRPEASWNLDTLWNNKKYFLGVEYERNPSFSDSAPFYTPPSEITYENDDQMSKSEEYFPKLVGYHADYVDSLAIFTPNNFSVNPTIHTFMEEYMRSNAPDDIYEIWSRCALLERATPYNDLQGYQAGKVWEQVSPVVGSIPLVGGLASMAAGLGVNAYKLYDKFKWWPRLYAFGRQYEPAPSPLEMDKLYKWYDDNYDPEKEIQVYACDRNKAQVLIGMLVNYGYIKSSDVVTWLT